ncbi:MAG: energy-coupling factor ABC transporter permease, partial [Candidatus Thiodiazotropha sp. (ex Codakia orbicularis)]|nr:energy-coupling factor ABC transporter permease [Candidatus Thiodiazotropha sp. (ex Codakia orbicularis)]
MHIPDGFIAPQFYLPAYLVAGGFWVWASRDLRQRLDEETIPRLAVITALAYVVGLVMLPLPGGSSGHLVGIGILAMLFGIRLAFLAYSLVLLLQALLLGAGGMTALPVNALAVGLIGASVMAFSMR